MSSSRGTRSARRHRQTVNRAVAEVLEERLLMTRVINSASLNGGNSVMVAPGATITVALNVTTSGVAGDTDWRSTSWRIGSASSYTVVDHADHLGAGTYSETFTITAPTTEGIYGANFIAYEDDPGTLGASATFTLSSSVTVDVSAPTITVTSPVAGTYNASTWNGAFTGTASDSFGVDAVDIRIQRDSTDLYWNGTSFSNSSSTFVATNAMPAPSYIGKTVNSSSTSRTTATISHTVPAGNDRLLTVSVLVRGNESASTVTYAGAALKRAVQTSAGTSGEGHVEIWYLVAPAVGTANVVVTFASSVSPSAVSINDFTGVHQSDPIGDTSTKKGTSNNPSVNVTTQKRNSILFAAAFVHGGDTDPFTPGNNITEVMDRDTGTGIDSDAGVWAGYRTVGNTGTFTMEATAAVADDWAIAAIEIKAIAPTDWVYTFPFSKFPGDGSYTMRARVTDLAGRTAGQNRTFTIDTIAQTPSLLDVDALSDSGRDNTDNVTNIDTPTLVGIAEPRSTITLYDGGSAIGTTTADTLGAWRFTPSVPFAEGLHSITASAVDPVGNVSAVSDALIVTIDKTAPALTINPVSGAIYSQLVTVSGTATDPRLDSVLVAVKDGTTLLTSGAATLTDNAWTWSFVAPRAGSLTVESAATDLAGNSTLGSTPLVIAKATPTITWANPADIAYGDALGVNQLNATASVPGIFNYTPGLGTVLTSGTHQLLANFTPTDTQNYEAVGATVSINVVRGLLTVTADSQSRMYGDANAPLTGSISGIRNGDNISVIYTTTATQQSSVGGYLITPVLQDPDGKLANYDLVVNPGVLTITKVPLSVTALSQTKTYGDPNPPLTSNVVGIKNGDSLTVTCTTPATQFSNAGQYSITPVINDPDGKLGNYDLTSTNATLTINKANQVITWANPAPIAYGTALSAAQLNASVAGVPGGSAPGSLTYTPGMGTILNAGTTTLQVSAAETVNYNPATATVQINVNAAELTITVANVTRMYGQPNPTFSATITGFANGEDESVLSGKLVLSTLATPASDVGTYAITASGVSSPNYTIKVINGTLTVTKSPLQVITSPATRLYGQDNPTFTGSIIGLVNGDNISAVYTTAATPLSEIGTYPIVALLSDPGQKLRNYTVVNNGNTLTIVKADLAITVDPQTKTYGQPNPSLTGTVAGLAYGDGVTITYSTSATQFSDAGQYPIIATINDPGNRLKNYSVANTPNTLTINKANQVITWATPLSIVYGNPLTTKELNATVAGVPGGSAPGELTYTPGLGTVLDAGTNVLQVSAAATQNYNAAAAEVLLVVAKAPLTVTISPAAYQRIFGAPNPTFTGFVTGLVNNDTVTVTYSTPATLTSDVGNYPVTASISGPRAKNYNLTYQPGTLQITPCNSTMSLSAPRYSGLPVTFTATVTQTAPSQVPPNGTATLYEGGTMLGVISIVNGTGSLALSTLSLGDHTVWAFFNSVDSTPSVSSAIPVTIVSQPTVASFVINDGAVQRSSVTKLSITFDRAMSLTASDVSLQVITGSTGNPAGMSVVAIVQTTDNKTFTFTFAGGSLQDGVYQFTILPTAHDAAGQTVNFSRKFHRLLGDANGDKRMDSLDLALIKASYGAVTAANSYLDLNGDAKVDNSDLLIMSPNYGKRYVY